MTPDPRHDSSGLCWFVTWGMAGALDLTAETLYAVTGWKYTADELRKAGERLMHLERAFNVRHGLTPEDDYFVPERLVEAPPDGRAAGRSIGPHLREMIDKYYELMEWDPKSGKPWDKTLKKVGLDGVSGDLWG